MYNAHSFRLSKGAVQLLPPGAPLLQVRQDLVHALVQGEKADQTPAQYAITQLLVVNSGVLVVRLGC